LHAHPTPLYFRATQNWVIDGFILLNQSLGREKEMGNIKKIATLDEIVQAQMLESILNERGIPHVMQSYHDSAYDGLFQGQKGWGHIEAPEEHETEILTLLDDLRIEDEQDSPQEDS
jgi:hypothetical protein